MSLAEALTREEEKLLHCVHCGFCLPECPTYGRLGDEADSPRGRLYLMRAVVEGRLDPGSDAFQTHIDRCLGCRACEPVCPSGVAYGFLLERAREAAAEARRPGLLTRALLGIMGRPGAEGAFLGLSRAARATGVPALLARLLPGGRLLGSLRLASGMLAASAPAPLADGVGGKERAPASETDGSGRGAADGAPAASARVPGGAPAETTGAESRSSRAAGAGEAEAPPGAGTVGVLEGCVQAGLFGRVNQATVRVLEANGVAVVRVPSQGCCGALHAHGGRLERARELARSNVRAFREAGVEAVVVNAAGCGAAMKEYAELLEDDPELAGEARELAGRVRDISEILAEAGPRRGGSLPLRVAYDAPCHLLHGQGVEEAPVRVLEAVPDLELVPLRNASECCGGAGIYGLTHPELGGRIGSDKVEAVLESGAGVVTTGNPGCIMQIGAGLRMAGADVPVVHPVELLDESYRRGGVYADRGADGAHDGR